MTNQSLKKYFEDGHFLLSLIPISSKEISQLSTTPCDLYYKYDDQVELLYKKQTSLSPELIKGLSHKSLQNLLIQHQDLPLIQHEIKKQLTLTSRGLSIGDIHTNSKRLVQLLSLNLHYIYKDPTDDDLLSVQVQGIRNFTSFLLEHPQMIHPLYEDILTQDLHYIYQQPLISSILLLGFLRSTRLFGQKEIESLFMTSYLKDIGMSMLPLQTFETEILSDTERELIKNHPEYSVSILESRVPLSPSYLGIIKHHHTHGLLNPHSEDELRMRDQDNQLHIVESILVNIMDILAAMITSRPYREATGLFEALEFIRVLMGDTFPKEYKLLVNYFHHFFSKRIAA